MNERFFSNKEEERRSVQAF